MIQIFATYTKDWQPLLELVQPLWQEYATRHGYELVFLEVPPILPGHYSFTKTAEVAKHLRIHKPEALWVIDLDMIPTNMTIPIRQIWLGKSFMPAVQMTRDINGLNSGSYLIEPIVGAYLWLDTIVGLRSVCSSEQHAMWLIQEAFQRLVHVLPHPSINSLDYEAYPDYRDLGVREDQGQWAPGHLIYHLPGKSMEDRITLLKKRIPQIVR